MNNDHDLVKIAAFFQPMDAYLLKTRLEAAGITCFVFDDLTVSANNYLSNAVGGVKVYVSEKDAAEALEIINVEPEEESVCLNCGSKNLRFRRTPIWVHLGSLIVFRLPFLLKGTWECEDCGDRW
ncbi:MAG TPA: DUF2007 domain-containing protein [Firmicutes bacterium]|nr:DUF2007 domain-containing protein [Bacillota bacterium]